MIYGYENLNNDAFPQISQMIEAGEYTAFALDRIFRMERFRRTPAGNIIPPKPEEDEEYNLLNFLKEGDIVLTSTLTNFSTTTDGILLTLNEFLHQKARVISVLEDFDSNKLDQKTFEMMINISHKTRQRRWMSQKKGIETARKSGRYGKQVRVEDLPQFEELYQEYKEGKKAKAEIARRLKISRPTLDKLFSQRQMQEGITNEKD